MRKLGELVCMHIAAYFRSPPAPVDDLN
jgi:hypothetical protein